MTLHAILIFLGIYSDYFSDMESFSGDQLKTPRKRQMSRAKRILANRRERERVRKMNAAFEELRNTIPNHDEIRVKTKLELLRIATNYIQTLKDTIKKNPNIHDGYSPPCNALMYASPLEMESRECSSQSGSCISDLPCPSQFSAPLPPGYTELTNFQFVPNQTTLQSSQYPATLTCSTENATGDFCSLLSASLAESHSAVGLLSNLQVMK